MVSWWALRELRRQRIPAIQQPSDFSLFLCVINCSFVSDSVRPQRWQPTRLPHPRDSPGKNTEVACHFLLQCVKVKSESEVAQSCPTPAIPWTAAHQAPPSMGFSRQEYWSGVPLPSLVPLLRATQFLVQYPHQPVACIWKDIHPIIVSV